MAGTDTYKSFYNGIGYRPCKVNTVVIFNEKNEHGLSLIKRQKCGKDERVREI